MVRKHIFIFLLIGFLFQPLSADEEHSSNAKEFLGKTLNFVILFGGLAYLLHKPLRNFLEGRATKIEKSLEEMKESRHQAELKLKQIKERLSHLEEEIAEIKKAGEVNGLEERDRIIEEARRESERIKRFAQEEIEMLTRAGMAELREYAADLATTLAQERIKKKTTPEIASQLIDRSIEKIEGLYENTNTDKEIRSRVS